MANPSEDEQSVADERLLDLIAEYHDRVDQGESLEPAIFASAYPDMTAELSRYFENVATLESLAGPTAGQVQNDPTATVITGETRDGGHTETVIEDSSSGAAARISNDAPLTQFGRYRIRKELGRGAMGAVYLAHDEQLDREVALKIPRFETDMNDDLLERFYREARAAAALQHSGICPVYDVGELDGQHYITMGFIKGRPLRDFTRSSKRQKGKQVARVIRKVALAMAEAHEHNVTHRDLKPANIMINQKNEPVVMDFGLARRSTEGEERLTHTGTVIGTPAYMSPEQVDGDNDHVGPQSDIYSLGVIFYEMLAGQLPFQGNLMSILKQIALSDPQPPDQIHRDIDPSLQAICLSMMAKNIDERPASMEIVAQDLTAWLQGQQAVTDESVALETSRVPGQQATGNDEVAAPLEKTAVSGIHVEQEATFARTPKQNVRGVHPRNKKYLIAAGLGGVVLLLAGIVIIAQLGKVKVQITLDDSKYSLRVDGDEVFLEGGEDEIRLSGGEHHLTVMQGDLVIDAPKSFTVNKDGKNAVRVVVLDETVHVLMNGEQPPDTSMASSGTIEPATKPSKNAGQPDVYELLTSDEFVWTEPENLGREINRGSYNYSPHLSDNGLELWYSANLGAKQNYDEILFASRPSLDEAWGTPVNIGPPVNSAGRESMATFSKDYLEMIVARTGGFYSSTRLTTDADWSEPVRLNGLSHLATSSVLTNNGRTLLASYLNRTLDPALGTDEGADQDIYEMTREKPGDDWSEPRKAKGLLNTRFPERMAWASEDGCVVLIESERDDGFGALDIWVARRPSITEPWEQPVNLGPMINTESHDLTPTFSVGSATLVFAGRRPGSRTFRELYFSRRVPKIRANSSETSLLANVSTNRRFGSVHALEFDGQRSIVEIPTLKCDGVTAITVEGWLNPGEKRRSNALNFVMPRGHSLTLQVGGFPRWEFGGGIIERDVYQWAHGPNIDQWKQRIHVAGIFADGQFTLFVNGKRFNSKPAPDGFSPSGSFSIGRKPWDAKEKTAYKGTIDEVRISRVARYTEGFTPRQRFESDADTLALYHFDEGQGDVLKDSSGNNHHGKIAGAKWVQITAPARAGPSGNVPPLATASFADGQIDLKHGLVGHWNFEDDDPAYSENLAGPKHRVRLQSSASRVTETPPVPLAGQRSLKLTGNADMPRTSDWPNLDLSEGLTLAGWARSDGEPESRNQLRTLIGQNYSESGFQLKVDGRLKLARGSGDVNVIPGLYDEIPHGEWYHIAATYDGTSVRIYLNGELKKAEAHTGELAVNRKDIRFGGQSDELRTDNPYWMDDLRLYTRALSGTEIAVLAGKTRLPMASEYDAPPLAVSPFKADEAKAHQQAWADYLNVPVEKEVELKGGVKMAFMLIPPGEFMMGSTDEERAKLREEGLAIDDAWSVDRLAAEDPQHRVRITKPFYLGKYEVTQAQWKSVTGNNPSKFSDKPTHPVEQVSWIDTQSFLDALNQGAAKQKPVFQLPTEAQWEFACRAGTTSRRHFDGDEELRAYGWFDANSSKTEPVGRMRPNPFGLYDLYGNVWEWCSDWYRVIHYGRSPVDDPVDITEGKSRVIRGGCWGHPPGHCRSANRGNISPDKREAQTGFRVVMTIETAKHSP